MQEYNIIHVINLPERDVRLAGFFKESDKEGFGVKVWPGIICKGDNKRGINLAHRAIVQYAKDNYYPWICIAEDDCRMFGNGGAWRYFIDNMPADFDIYFSMIYVGEIVNNRVTSVFSGMTMYIIHQRFYDFFLSLEESIHIDRELGKYADQFKFMVCDKFIAFQDGSKSDNTKTTCDYSPFLVGRKIYGDVKIA